MFETTQWTSCIKLNGDDYIFKLVKRNKFGKCESVDVAVDRKFIEQTINYLTEVVNKI